MTSDDNKKEGIVVEHLFKSFGRDRVLNDVNINIPPGSIHGVVGNNGSGKTVLMKCICGFMRQDKGKVYVNGAEIGKDEDFPGFVFIRLSRKPSFFG